MCGSKSSLVLFQQFTHIRLAQSHGNTVNASFDPRSKIVRLEGILRAEFTCSLGNWDSQRLISGITEGHHTLKL